jgi:hypothetical protein
MPRVAVIVSFVEQEYCRSLVRGITRYANANGSWEWEVFLAGNPEIKRINAREFDGVIFDRANPSTLAKKGPRARTSFNIRVSHKVSEWTVVYTCFTDSEKMR